MRPYISITVLNYYLDVGWRVWATGRWRNGDLMVFALEIGRKYAE